jgi:chromosome segregation ATPase
VPLLQQIEAETATGTAKSEESLRKIEDLSDRMDALQKKFTENEINVDKATREAIQAEELAIKAEEDADKLESEYKQVEEQLEAKYNETKSVKERADRLRDRASELYKSTEDKVNRLNGQYIIQKYFESQQIASASLLLSL